MTPPPLACALLALAALRCWRLLAQDSLPPLVRLRSWIAGSHYRGSTLAFDHPLAAEWLGCAWCSGLWWAASWYGAWLLWPHGVMYVAVPLALSAALACVASWLPE